MEAAQQGFLVLVEGLHIVHGVGCLARVPILQLQLSDEEGDGGVPKKR